MTVQDDARLAVLYGLDVELGVLRDQTLLQQARVDERLQGFVEQVRARGDLDAWA